MEEGDIVARIGEHAVKWSAYEFAATDERDVLVIKIDVSRQEAS